MQKLQSKIAKIGLNAHIFLPEDVEKIPRDKGAYLLFLRLHNDLGLQSIQHKPAVLKSGNYIYCGSANGPGGLHARLKRHFLSEKRQHWHIDRLTTATQSKAAMIFPDGNECTLLEKLLRTDDFEVPLIGFGSSDCTHCPSHLLRSIAVFGGN